MAESLPTPRRAAEATPPPEPTHRAAEVIGEKYVLERLLGTGGFGEVWVAHDQVLDVHVALKLLSPSPAGSSQGPRLLREARAAALLGHPAIVRVFEFGEATSGAPYMAMELLHGQTLWNVLEERSRVPPGEALQMLLPIADALAVAHAKGIVHRDVKAENVFIARDELGRLQPKLLDFGLAQVAQKSRLTGHGAVIGTPSYMSPEQARGEEEIDLRADVWAFTVLLYELITGRLPFEGSNYNALIQSIIADEPVPSTDHSAGDSALWTLIKTGLAKKREQRWESMRVFGEALALWLYDHGVREDICNVSLRTSWLEAEHSDVKVVVGSVPPGSGERVTEPPEPSSGAKEPPAASSVGSPPESKASVATAGPVRFGNTVVLPRTRARRARRWLVPSLVALLVLTGLVVLIALRRGTVSQPQAGDDGVVGIEADPANVKPAPAPQSEPTAARVASPVLPAADQTPAAPAAKPSAPAASPGPRSKLPSGKPPKGQPKKDIDLGF